MKKSILIITDTIKQKNAFFEAPYFLPPETVKIIGPSSLKFLGYKDCSSIIIDSPSLQKTLKKLSLGIRDTDELESLWQIFSGESEVPVYVLIDRKSAQTKEMRELGIEFIVASELIKLVKSENSYSHAGYFSDSETINDLPSLLTADDIREMHQNGARNISPNNRLTAWASEVAESLGMNLIEPDLKFLVNIANFGKQNLKNSAAEIHELATRFKNLFFVISPPMMPIFSDLFPAYKSKIISPTIHWESKGAYTGESSAPMLADQNCFGAIVSPTAPYNVPENISKLVDQAKKYNLELFSTFTLASGTGCDIIATDKTAQELFTPLYRLEVVSQANMPDTGAILANLTELLGMPPQERK